MDRRRRLEELQEKELAGTLTRRDAQELARLLKMLKSPPEDKSLRPIEDK